jgi:hypothetical protein
MARLSSQHPCQATKRLKMRPKKAAFACHPIKNKPLAQKASGECFNLFPSTFASFRDIQANHVNPANPV